MNKKSVVSTIVICLGVFILAFLGFYAVDGIMNKKDKEAQQIEQIETDPEETKPAVSDPEGALKTAENLIRYSAYSYDGLIDALIANGYTEKDAANAVKKLEDTDWSDQAYKAADKLLEKMPYSKEGLKKKLIEDKFTKQQAEYAAGTVETSWQVQAYKRAKIYIGSEALEAEELAGKLINDGFEKQDVEYAVNAIFEHEYVDVDALIAEAKNKAEAERTEGLESEEAESENGEGISGESETGNSNG